MESTTMSYGEGEDVLDSLVDEDQSQLPTYK